jgi:iron complex transport system permease protein
MKMNAATTMRSRAFGLALIPIILGIVLLVLLSFADLIAGSGQVTIKDLLLAPARPQSVAQIIIETIRLPRLFAAILVGAALAAAGTTMQTILRNPLAAPDILAVTSGAQLALVISSLLLPFAFPGFAATILGGAIGGMVCLSVGGGLRAQPVRLALAGVAVSLAFSALTAAIILTADDRASGIILWSSGILDQTGWNKILSLVPLVFAGIILLIMFGRQFDVMNLGNDIASSLGLGKATAIIGLLLSVILAGAAVSIAGPIGFIGLAVPNFLRAVGLIKHRILLPAACIWGAVTLLGADVIAQGLSKEGRVVPTGILAACLAAPVLIMILRKVKTEAGSRANVLLATVLFARKPMLYGCLLLVLSAAVFAGLTLGDGILGRQIDWSIAYTLRMPRVLIAMGAGALLAVAGLLLQAVTRNPLSGPETLGLAQGAALASLLALLVGFVPGSPLFALFAALGAGSVVVLIAVVGRRLSPASIALTGLAIAASLSALSTLVVIEAKLQVAEALSWLAGSTHARSWRDVEALSPWLILPLLTLALAKRLDILALGHDGAQSLGVDPASTRIWAMVLAAFCVAGAVAAVGAIGFVGLIAPHAARLCCGARYRHLLPVTALIGAILTVLADMIGRSIIAPHEIPAGIVTAFIGTPLFIVLMRKQSR